MSLRAISYSEGSTLLDCQAKWDMSYGDQLAGSSLKSKETPVLLRDGRAWGQAVQAFHQVGGDYEDALLELMKALDEDAEEQREAGLFDEDDYAAKTAFMRALLEHYVARQSEDLTLQELEKELLVPLPSRSGTGDSNRYRLQVFFDGVHVDPAGRTWLVEFKLRTQLSSLDLIAKSRQIRYYAWAYRKETGADVAGVIVEERLKDIPKPARWVKPKKKDEGIVVTEAEAAELGAPMSDAERASIEQGKIELRRTVSHAKDQVTTAELYAQACKRAGVDRDEETFGNIASRVWQQRHQIFLTDTEIEEAGRELVSLGHQVAALDSHKVYPVRNPSRARCPGCFYKDVCNSPRDAELVDALFDRRPPKHERVEASA